MFSASKSILEEAECPKLWFMFLGLHHGMMWPCLFHHANLRIKLINKYLEMYQHYNGKYQMIFYLSLCYRIQNSKIIYLFTATSKFIATINLSFYQPSHAIFWLGYWPQVSCPYTIVFHPEMVRTSVSMANTTILEFMIKLLCIK